MLRSLVGSEMCIRDRDWEWSRLKPTARSGPDGLLSPGPLPKRSQWTRFVNGAETEDELKALRQSVRRGTPFGTPDWQQNTATQLGLESSMRPRGRPKKIKK